MLKLPEIQVLASVAKPAPRGYRLLKTQGLFSRMSEELFHPLFLLHLFVCDKRAVIVERGVDTNGMKLGGFCEKKRGHISRVAT